jgi:hypothetical protein
MPWVEFEPTIRAFEDISCLRPRGHCDRPFRERACDKNLSLRRPVSITTDGAPAVVGSRNGFAGLCRRDESIPLSLAYRSIIHQEALCTKAVNFKRVMNVLIKIINAIRSVSYPDLILHNWIPLAQYGQSCFQDSWNSCKIFRSSWNPEMRRNLTDACWLLDLAFHTDITLKLNVLNILIEFWDIYGYN